MHVHGVASATSSPVTRCIGTPVITIVRLALRAFRTREQWGLFGSYHALFKQMHTSHQRNVLKRCARPGQ